MASFVETATLKVIDQSSAPVQKINKELTRLTQTVAKLRQNLGKVGEIKINASQVSRATKQLQDLNKQAVGLKRNMKVDGRVRINGLSQTRRDLVQLSGTAANLKGRLNLKGRINVDAGNALQTLNKLTNRANAAGQALGRVGARFPNMPNSGPQPRNPPNVPQKVTVEYSGFAAFMNGMLSRLGSTIEGAIISGFKQGYQQQDVADVKLGLLSVPPEKRAAITAASEQIAARDPILSRATAQGFMAENYALTGGDVNAATQLSQMQAELVRLSVALGESADQATESAFKYSKAADTAGLLTDAAGKFDPKAAQQFFDTLKQAKAQFGQEITADLISTVMKSARGSKFSLAPNSTGLLTLLSMAEESGSTAAVGMNQLLKQLRGVGVKAEVLGNQADYGLVKTEEVKTGKVGGKQSTKLVAAGSIDANMLLTDPRGFVEKYIIPQMLKRGLDPNNPSQALDVAQSLTGERTAVEALTSLILKNQDIERNVQRAQALNMTPENVKRITDESGLVALTNTTNQLTGLMGQVANSFETILIPALNGVSSIAQSLSNFVAGPDGKGDPTRAALAVGATGLAGYAGYKTLTSVIDVFGLKGSAAALTGSATQLSAAALALQRAAGVNTLGNNNPGAPPGVPGGSKWVKMLDFASKAAGWIALASAADDAVTGGKGKEIAADRVSKLNTVENFLLDRLFKKIGARDENGESTQKSWKEFFIGDAAKPGFKLKDALAIQTTGSEYAKNGNNPLDPQALQTEIADGAQKMQNAFTMGGTDMAAKVTAAGGDAGAAAASAILASAMQWGAAAGSALRAQIGTIGVNINAPQQAQADTGKNPNEAR